jgi:hypothetical protein
VFTWPDQFSEAFSALHARDQEILRLAIWEDLAPAEGALVLGCTAGTFKVRAHRARQRLLRQLERDGVLMPDAHPPETPSPGGEVPTIDDRQIKPRPLPTLKESC